MEEDKTLQGYIILVVAVFTWSWSEIIVKLLQGSVGALSLSFFRFFIGGLFLLGMLIVKKDLKGIRKMIKNNLPLFLIASCFAFGISNVIYFIGVTNTQANVASTIYTTYPIWITIYSVFILDERTNLKFKFVGILIGVLAVSILMTNFNLLGIFSSENAFGNLLVLLGSITWSLYSVLGKKIQINEKDTSNIALKFSAMSSLFAGIPVFGILIFTSEVNTFFQYDFEAWFWIFFLGIVSTGFGIYLLFVGIKYVEVSKGFSLAFLKPIFAMILAFLILKEEPTLALYIAISMVMVAIILINRKVKVDSTLNFDTTG